MDEIFILTVFGVSKGRPKTGAGAYLLQKVIDGKAVEVSQDTMLIKGNGKKIKGSQDRVILEITIAGMSKCPAGSQVVIQSVDKSFIPSLQTHGDSAAKNYSGSLIKDAWKRYAKAKARYSVEPRHVPTAKKHQKLGIIVENLARNALAQHQANKRVAAKANK